MKHNPRLNEKMARLPGFGDIHPLQPQSTVQGALELIAELARWLKELTGMPAVAMSPKAGAHGELCGMMAIRAAIEARGEDSARKAILVPESAHGTNPATGGVRRLRGRSTSRPRPDGTRRSRAREKQLAPDVAAIMLTNPNTCGLFERDIVEIAEAVHEAGRLFLLRRREFQRHRRASVRPGDLGVDAMHINLHKTFSTPHGGGGPGRRAGRAVGASGAFRAAAFLFARGTASASSRTKRKRRRRVMRRSGACAPSTARWACSCAP